MTLRSATFLAVCLHKHFVHTYMHRVGELRMSTSRIAGYGNSFKVIGIQRSCLHFTHATSHTRTAKFR